MTKNKCIAVATIWACLMLSEPGTASPPGEPQYASKEAKQVIESMTRAHGGLTKWLQASSVSYDFVMYLPSIPLSEGMNQWDIWVTKKTTIQPATLRAFTELPWEGPAQVASDGKKLWTTNYSGPMPPLFRLWHHASFINLPWLLHDSRVHFGNPEMARLPGDEKEYTKVRLTVERNGKVKPDKYWDLYIDPETHLLKANAYTMAFYVVPEPLMPKQEMPFPGTMLRVVDRYVEVNGLTFPSHYITTDLSGERVFGMHFMINTATDRPFDEKRMKMSTSDMVVK